jgi:hypothetical protein
VVAKLHSDSRCRLEASVREQANQDDLLFVVALQLLVKVSIREAAGRPMLRRDNVARLHLEVVVKPSAPRALGKGLPFCRAQLVGRRVFPVDVVARFPSVVRYVEDANARLARRPDNGPQVLQHIESVPLAGGIIGAGSEIAWPRPTRPGDVLHVVSTVVDIAPSQSKPDRGIVTVQSDTLNQEEQLCQRSVARLLAFRRNSGFGPA